ncbi:calcium-binding protein [Arenibacterium halophilum]|uniref:Calcium-binding protein n=1 Tax=Arenibacterium halophilum TaxID=2583821 RepID=A0ABY2XB81_9RHOB|nr:calcium-binding protein [Arenibacterium halophilum]TMV13619.1 calcium-binding protein [Arenibacterium halophilum]
MANFTIITDAFFGTPGPDWFLGTGGDDDFRALGGNDRIEVTSGTDSLNGGDGFDTFRISKAVLSQPDNFTAIGENFGAEGKDILRFIDIEPDELRMWSTAGGLNFSLDGGGVVLIANSGKEFWDQFKAVRFDDGTRWSAKNGFVAIGLRDAQNHYGTPNRDTIKGMEGDDFIWGNRGSDWLFGGSGDDSIRGESGHDRIFGGLGLDVLEGLLGNDRLWGGPGDDQLYGWDGKDILKGGSGSDKLYGQIGDDRLFGGTGNDLLQGLQGNDILNGQKGNDQLNGGDEHDRVYGGPGDDEVRGGNGDDIIVGGRGNDFLQGNTGVDTYVFNQRDGHDRIMDVDVRRDIIDLSKLGIFESLDELKAMAIPEKPTGGDVVIDLSPKAGAMAHTLFIFGVTPEQLDELTFLF